MNDKGSSLISLAANYDEHARTPAYYIEYTCIIVYRISYYIAHTFSKKKFRGQAEK